MSHIEAQLSFIREDDHLIGIQIMSGPEAHSERFCTLLPKAIADGTALVSVAPGEFVLTQPEMGHCCFAITEEQAAEIEPFINHSGPYEGVEYQLHDITAFTPGFKIVLAGKENAGELSEPVPSIA